MHDLRGTDSFAWVSAAYTLACTSILPLSGRLAEIFGRRPILLGSLFLFAVGSALCASAHSMKMLIAGRGNERYTLPFIHILTLLYQLFKA